MKRKIKITAGEVEALAQLNDSEIAGLIWETLPISTSANTWGDEIYFPIPVTAKLENPVEVVGKGDLGYWPEGKSFCIFFGPTPISSGDEIKPASSVEIVGKLSGNPEEFKKIGSGETITLEKLTTSSSLPI